MWKVLHSRWTVVSQVEWSVLQWTLCDRYCKAGGQFYCRLKGVCCSEHYVEDIAQQVDSSIAGWMECVTVNIMWKLLYRRWTVVLQVEFSVLSEHYVDGAAKQEDNSIYGWMECVKVNIMWKVLHSKWTVVLQVEWSVLQWRLFDRYCKAGAQFYCRLKGVCCSEHYVENTAQQVDSSIAGWMEFVTVNIMWKVLYGRWTVVMQVQFSVLSEHYVDGAAQQVDCCSAGWMDCVTVNIIWKVLHSRWTVVLQFEWRVLQ